MFPQKIFLPNLNEETKIQLRNEPRLFELVMNLKHAPSLARGYEVTFKHLNPSLHLE
jgi:hypothetical protein